MHAVKFPPPANGCQLAWSMVNLESRPTNNKRVGGGRKENMRVAIAGTGGLAHYIAYHIHQETGHQLVWFSKTVSRNRHSLDIGDSRYMV